MYQLLGPSVISGRMSGNTIRGATGKNMIFCRKRVFDVRFLLKIELEICSEASSAKPNRNERQCAKTPNVDVLNKRVAQRKLNIRFVTKFLARNLFFARKDGKTDKAKSCQHAKMIPKPCNSYRKIVFDVVF